MMKEWLNSAYSDGSGYFVSNPLPKKGESIRILLRCIRNEELKYVILRAKVNGAEQLITMNEYKEVNGLIYYSCEIRIWEDELRYQFYLVTEKEIYYYTQYRITDYVPDEIYDFCILTNYQQPEWVKKAVFYQIFPDRFYNGDPSNDVKADEYQFQGHGTIHIEDWDMEPMDYLHSFGLDFYGGDLKGIKDKIPYLKELGVTALYINPIFRAATVHKYDCIDYFEIDEHLGGNQALAELSQVLHENGMKIVLDISINHTGSASRWFNKECIFYPESIGAYHNKDAKERSYYFINDDNSYLGWYGVESLPVLNYTSQELRDKVYRAQDSVIKKWLKEPYCIDGWRFDVADVMARNNKFQLHKEIWPEIRNSVKEEKEDAYILAEDWGDCVEHLRGNEWDATMNYFACARPIREFVGEIDLFQQRKEELQFYLSKMTADNLRNRIAQYLGKLPFTMQEVQFNMIDTHDISRLHNNVRISFEDYKTAVILYFTLPGTPSIYYGDEVGIKGRIHDVEGSRYPMPWKDGKERSKYYQLYQNLTRLKTTKDALMYGGLKFISSNDYVLVYARCSDMKTIFIIASADDMKRVVKIPYTYYGYTSCEKVTDALGAKVNWDVKNNKLNIYVPPHSSYILELN
ncbi:alpha-amylase family glycosyl hydrolase [Anaerocolumna aminovalerica]|uniref:alpha-amylase family glycosyl hydrolase n=1 Tax=Anaerocolumna aminovalerica TaxID=1527 RepID=UPI00248ADD62|nr:alpha-amylase family glycosyl hydrolase [Anaerocolumna aminovalerica]